MAEAARTGVRRGFWRSNGGFPRCGAVRAGDRRVRWGVNTLIGGRDGVFHLHRADCGAAVRADPADPGSVMGKRGIERPHVVGTRLNDAEQAKMDADRGSIPVATWIRHLIVTAKKP